MFDPSTWEPTASASSSTPCLGGGKGPPIQQLTWMRAGLRRDRAHHVARQRDTFGIEA
jgi:hypothetical protein